MSEETGRVRVEVSAEMWTAIHAPGLDPSEEVARRGADVLRMKYDCEEDEVQMIIEDPLYRDSARTEYWAVKKRFDRKRKLPGHMTLEFNRPGTRNRRMKEVEAEP